MRSVASVSKALFVPGFGRVRRLVAAVFTGAIVALALAVPALAVPVGFEDVVVATGLDRPTAMAVAPDGRVFVAQQGGQLRVVKNDVLLPTPFVTVPVASSNERGLLGVAFDPNFAVNRYVYVYYTANTNPIVNRVSRFTASTANPDVAAAGSEVFILNNIPSPTGWHNGGAIHFGSDGKLYVAVGEGHNASSAQSLGTLAGKLLRLNPDGSIPTDNPFYNTASGNNRAVWAMGLRNPFTFDIQPGTGRIFVNDVGAHTWEEINDASTPGRNFGWPTCEGPQNTGVGNCTSTAFTYPFYAYQHAGSVCAITGGAFYNPSSTKFPAEYVGDYFFADPCAGWIQRIDLTTKAVVDFVAPGEADGPVDIKVASDGSLYYLGLFGLSSGRLHRIRYVASGQPPAIASHPQNATAPVGGSATLTVSASGTPPLSYQWQRNGVNISGATASSYTISNVQTSDNGAQFRVRVTNAQGNVLSNAATLAVTSNQAPTATITAPAAGTLYSAGQTINYSGTGTDPQDGNEPASRFTWRVDFHHDSHTHPFIPDTTGSQSGSFTIPTTGETSSNVFYRIYLTVRDSGGLTHTTFRDVQPRKVNVTLTASPSGLQLTLDGQPVATPFTFTGVVGISRTIGAPSPQNLAGKNYQFVSWSDARAQTHTIATPTANTSYTATYREVSGTTPPTQGLVGYWSFDDGSGGTASDGSGNGHTGTLTYGPSWQTGTNCKLRGCLAFDGVNDYVNVADAADLRITGSVTISAWIRPASPGSKQSIVGKQSEFKLFFHNVAPYPIRWSHISSTSTLEFGALTPSTTANQWVHVVLVRDAATKQIRGYVNGSLISTATYTVTPGTSTNPVVIGAQRFKGQIDEVRLYNRVLTLAEVSAIFNQT